MLVGLHGRLGPGKDAVYERLCYHGFGPVRIAFADKLKVSAMACLGYSKDYFGEALLDEELVALANDLKDGGVIHIYLGEGGHHTITGREYLQYAGTEGHRDVFGSDFWVEQALLDVTNETEGLYTVTDTRFPNEAEAILARGGEVWRIIGANEETGDHPSEIPLPDEMIARTIDNTIRDDDFASLDQQLRSIMKAIATKEAT